MLVVVAVVAVVAVVTASVGQSWCCLFCSLVILPMLLLLLDCGRLTAIVESLLVSY